MLTGERLPFAEALVISLVLIIAERGGCSGRARPWQIGRTRRCTAEGLSGPARLTAQNQNQNQNQNQSSVH